MSIWSATTINPPHDTAQHTAMLKIACNAGPTRHAALAFYTTAFDAFANQQEALHRGASRYLAF